MEIQKRDQIMGLDFRISKNITKFAPRNSIMYLNRLLKENERQENSTITSTFLTSDSCIGVHVIHHYPPFWQ